MELSKGDLIIWVSEVHIVLINCLLKQDNNDYNTDQKKKKTFVFVTSEKKHYSLFICLLYFNKNVFYSSKMFLSL